MKGKVTKTGYKKNSPDKNNDFNIIPSNRISMKNVEFPVLGISNKGDKQFMLPGGEYGFIGSTVTEFPLSAKSGIHIKPENKGKFNATKKATGKTTEELTHSKNPITKKRAIFAQNAKKWKHQEGGIIPPVDNNIRKYVDLELQRNYPGISLDVLDRTGKPVVPGIEDTPAVAALRKGYAPLTSAPISVNPNSVIAAGMHDFTKNYAATRKIKDQSFIAKYQGGGTLPTYNTPINPAGLPEDFVNQQLDFTGMPFGNSQLPLGQQIKVGANKIGQGIGKVDNALGDLGGIGGALSTGMDVMQGLSMIKAEKNQRKEAKQFSALSDVVAEASSIRPEGPKRKYVRPEDQIIDPETLSNSYGNGTNYLAKNGKKMKKAQFGQQLGSFGNMLGSKAFGGGGNPNGAGKIGSTIGSTVGNILLPGIGGNVLGAVGGFIGGAIGAKGQKETNNYIQNAEQNLQTAAFQQGSQNIQNQYSGFMKDGGNMQMGGQLQTYWGGEAEVVSVNPYLPEGGESVLFKGKSHDDGGIGVKFGKSSVEVEGGEPAVKLNDEGNTSSLVVFGDMKIPSYGVSEIGDPKAKGKKFKNYINDLNKVESKQSKIIDKNMDLLDKANPKDVYDKLKISSGQAMLTGADMNLKEIAKKKTMASIVQNAILETAEDKGLKPNELAEGKFRKDKKAKSSQQWGGKTYPTSINRADTKTIQTLLDEGWTEKDNNLYKEFITPGERQAVQNSSMYLGSEDFQKAFGQARDKRLSEFDFQGKKYTTKLAQSVDYKDSPDTREEGYIPLYDEYKQPAPTEKTPINNPSPDVKGLGIGSFLGAYMPFIRGHNNLARPDLSPEMFSLAANNLDPVQAQLYEPLLENVTDLSYQDQLNANQSDFNSIQRQVGNNPAALASLAGQKYAANSSVLGEEFRVNQNARLSTYNRNRATLNDATLKNLGILDNQYVRQSTAKSNTKAVAQAALSSIADKIGQYKRDQTVLNIDQQRYNYRFGPNGMAWNVNGPAMWNIPEAGSLPTIDPTTGREVTTEKTVKTDKNGNPAGTTVQQKVKEIFNKKNPKSKNGSLVQSFKSY